MSPGLPAIISRSVCHFNAALRVSACLPRGHEGRSCCAATCFPPAVLRTFRRHGEQMVAGITVDCGSPSCSPSLLVLAPRPSTVLPWAVAVAAELTLTICMLKSRSIRYFNKERKKQTEKASRQANKRQVSKQANKAKSGPAMTLTMPGVWLGATKVPICESLV